MMMKPILAVVAALSLAIAGVGVANKCVDGGKCQDKCGLDCPDDCGGDCPGNCGPEGCKGCDDGCGHGEARAKATDETEAKANTGEARVAETKLVSLKGEDHEPGHRCGHEGHRCGHKRGHNGDHPEGHEGCKDKCGHGADMAERIMGFDKNDDGKVSKDELPEPMQRILQHGDTNQDGAIDKDEAEKMAERFGDKCGHGEDRTEANADVTSAARLAKTKLVSLKGEGHEAGNCPGNCGPEGCKGCDDGCGHGEGKAKAADKTEAKANTGGARLAKTKLVSLKGEGHEPGHKCGHKGGHNGDHPEGHEGCKDKCGHGEGKAKAAKTEAKINARVARLAVTK